MIDAAALLKDTQKLADRLVDDLRDRTDTYDESRITTRGTYERAQSAGRTDKTYEEWREDLLAQVAAAWVLGCVFVRFCEDNGLYDTPLLSGPGDRRDLGRDHRAAFFADNPAAGDREWLEEVFGRYRKLPGTADIFGDRNPLWQLAPSADGAKALLELWWATDDEGRTLRHDFTDAELDTRFLGDLYQDLSEHARKQYALLQTPEFVEEFILDRTLDPAIETFGLAEVKMIDPTCGSGHFLLGAFERLLERWRQTEPATDVRELARRTLEAVNGVDINPFAAEIARFRLLVAALQACGLRRLDVEMNWRINVAVGDSLLHGTRPGSLLSGTEGFDDALKHHYPTEDAEEAERILTSDTYHCVVGNPPYITVKDGALNAAYRSLYKSCHRQYALSVPFVERFHDLAKPQRGGASAGFVGQITSNSFMKRSFGTKLVTEHLAKKRLTHVIDTSGAYIPGHGTPTVILFSRDAPREREIPIRAVLGIRGEPGRPALPPEGEVWGAIVTQVDSPGSESDYVSVEDIADGRLDSHPWSLQGGAAPWLFGRFEEAALDRLQARVADMGAGAVTRADDVYVLPLGTVARWGAGRDFERPYVTGTHVRDWNIEAEEAVAWPYEAPQMAPHLTEALGRVLWRSRAVLSERVAYGKSQLERGLAWFEYSMLFRERLRGDRRLAHAFISTHNQFSFDRGGSVFNRHAPVIKLPVGATEDEHLGLLGLLNSSAACFWMKQVFHSKGNEGYQSGIKSENWERFWEFDSTKLKQFPLPSGRPLRWAQALDDRAQRCSEALPSGVAEHETPARAALDAAVARGTALRREMVALQEELDWSCYHLYGLTDAELAYPIEELPSVEKGQRAFEIALARRMAAGEATSTWFARHGSTPITEIPEQWPEGYRRLVERRLELIVSDRAIKLLERPEYKRRWNWDDLADLEKQAQERWLLDRIEEMLSGADPENPQVTTIARLADELWRDKDARAVAEDLAGADVDPVKLVGKLVTSAGVPYLATYRLKKTGLVKRQAWERTWDLQRQEDVLHARPELPAGDPDHLTAEELVAEKKAAGLDKIPVPPKYKSSDFRDATTWKLRGKLDVPKERFILYPGTRAGADTSAVVGWAGWDHLQQARALAGLYTARKHDGAETEELTPLLAGILELLPWVLQWHDEPDPVYGERMGQFFAGFLETERGALGLSEDDLKNWRP